MSVDHVGCVRLGQQPTYRMGFFTNEADNVATPKEPAELNLAW